jgi:hypothetical protein
VFCQERHDSRDVLLNVFLRIVDSVRENEVGTHRNSPFGFTKPAFRIRLLAQFRPVPDRLRPQHAKGLLLEQPFYRVYGNGLSVCRSIASDADIIDLASEALSHRTEQQPRALIHICEVEVEEIRGMTSLYGGQPFCIYDQTVSRRDQEKPPVSTHAGIFQRFPAPGAYTRNERKRRQKDLAGQLREKFIAGKLDLASFRGGILVVLNKRAQNREFEAKASDTPAPP